jgi:hypothetical protein
MEICFDAINSHFPHLRENILLEVVFLAHKIHIQVPLELSIRHLVSRLILAVVFTIFLNSIVC